MSYLRGEYYVYIWYIKDSNHVFYVGKGHGDRCSKILKRNKTFKKYLSLYDCDYKILDDNLSEDDAYKLEEEYIKIYKSKGMAEANYHKGGYSGGNVFEYMPNDEKQDFVDKMTAINRKRCSTEKFKNNARDRITKLNSDKNTREDMTNKIRETWSDANLRNEQRQRSLNYARLHPDKIKDRIKKISKRCALEFDGKVVEFDSKKELFRYLKDEYNFTISRKQEQYLFNSNVEYKSFSKKKSYMDGMKIYYL